MLEKARGEAATRMIGNANKQGANAIIMFRFDSGGIDDNMSEVLAYGTAVVVEKV